MDLKECTFTFVAYGGVEVSNGAPGTFVSQIGEAHAANNRSLTDVVDKISGGMSFPAHSGDWVAAHPDQEAYEVDGLGGWWFNPALPELGERRGIRHRSTGPSSPTRRCRTRR